MKVSILKYIDQLIASRDKALALQAAEYERRLLALNHAHEANLLRNANFVSMEKFESFLKELHLYKEQINAETNMRQGATQGTQRNMKFVIGAFSAMLTLIMILNFVTNVFISLWTFFHH